MIRLCVVRKTNSVQVLKVGQGADFFCNRSGILTSPVCSQAVVGHSVTAFDSLSRTEVLKDPCLSQVGRETVHSS